MERPLRPAGRLPRPARRPLGRVRATHQGPYRAREGTTGGRSRPVDYDVTRVNPFPVAGILMARSSEPSMLRPAVERASVTARTRS